MSDQVVYTNPSQQPLQRDNGNVLVWVIIPIVLATLAIMYMFFTKQQPTNITVMNPQETQIPQSPQSTQTPVPQETQVPVSPQPTNTSLPSQIPLPSTLPIPTI